MAKTVKSWAFIAITLIMLTSLMPSSNSSEIDFKPITLEAAKAMAAESGKLIFIDCYTVWCGPCKWMAANTFKDPSVAELFNDKFINLKVEMEKDADGKELSMKYEVRAYPTLLVIDSKGKLVKKTVGAQDANGLITFANSALN